MVRPAPTVVGMSCTTLLIGKSASCSGATIIARNDDSGSGRYDPKRLVAVAPTDQPRHYRSTLSHVEIDLPETVLPSTSPANAAWSLERLTEAWKIIRSI